MSPVTAIYFIDDGISTIVIMNTINWNMCHFVYSMTPILIQRPIRLQLSSTADTVSSYKRGKIDTGVNLPEH